MYVWLNVCNMYHVPVCKLKNHCILVWHSEVDSGESSLRYVTQHSSI
jgi:hypothetical protein